MDQPIPSLLCMLTTPGSASDERWWPSFQPQPYQAEAIKFIERGDKNDQFGFVDPFWGQWNLCVIGRRAQVNIGPVYLLAFHISDQSPTLGRKRRVRRARGRQIQTNRQGGLNA